MRRKYGRIAVMLAGCVLLSGGCGNEKDEPWMPTSIQEIDGSGHRDTDSQGDKTGDNAGDSGSEGKDAAPADQGSTAAPAGEGIPEGQIKEQSFAVTLDGWGEVVFASFEPEQYQGFDSNGLACYGDVRFMLLKDGQVIYTLPGISENNVWYGQQFGQVVSVAFRDYNEDGRTDILIILEYAGVQGPNIDEPFREVRLYTQEEEGNAFIIDQLTMEGLRGYRDNMEEVYQGLEYYAKGYAVCTSKSVWEVERFARKVKKMILQGDFKGLSQAVAYPITVDGITYQDEQAFLKADFVTNLNPEIRTELEEESCQIMFTNWQGIMLGDGCVWIGERLNENLGSEELKVIALSGLTVLSDGNQAFPEISENTVSGGAIREVLQGSRAFYYGAENKELNLSQVRELVTSDTSIKVTPGNYAVVDLDRDGEDEVILSLVINGESDYGNLVFHYQDGMVYGYVFAYRAFSNIRADGTFMASEGAGDTAICRLSFDKESYEVDEITYCTSSYDAEMNLHTAYYVEHKEAAREEYDKAYGEWDELAGVEWRYYSRPTE